MLFIIFTILSLIGCILISYNLSKGFARGLDTPSNSDSKTCETCAYSLHGKPYDLTRNDCCYICVRNPKDRRQDFYIKKIDEGRISND